MRIWILGLTIGLFAAGCNSQPTGDGTPAQNVNENKSDAPDDLITIRFRNFTEADAVDVEFYASVDALASLPDDLFQPDNLVTRDIGLGGNGRIGPLREDTIELPCIEGQTLGTVGGTFVNAASGDINGTGVQRWMQQGAQFECGATIILDYASDGESFTTTLALQP